MKRHSWSPPRQGRSRQSEDPTQRGSHAARRARKEATYAQTLAFASGWPLRHCCCQSRCYQHCQTTEGAIRTRHSPQDPPLLHPRLHPTHRPSTAPLLLPTSPRSHPPVLFGLAAVQSTSGSHCAPVRPVAAPAHAHASPRRVQRLSPSTCGSPPARPVKPCYAPHDSWSPAAGLPSMPSPSAPPLSAALPALGPSVRSRLLRLPSEFASEASSPSSASSPPPAAA